MQRQPSRANTRSRAAGGQRSQAASACSSIASSASLGDEGRPWMRSIRRWAVASVARNRWASSERPQRTGGPRPARPCVAPVWRPAGSSSGAGGVAAGRTSRWRARARRHRANAGRSRAARGRPTPPAGAPPPARAGVALAGHALAPPTRSGRSRTRRAAPDSGGRREQSARAPARGSAPCRVVPRRRHRDRESPGCW